MHEFLGPSNKGGSQRVHAAHSQQQQGGRLASLTQEERVWPQLRHLLLAVCAIVRRVFEAGLYHASWCKLRTACCRPCFQATGMEVVAIQGVAEACTYMMEAMLSKEDSVRIFKAYDCLEGP